VIFFCSCPWPRFEGMVACHRTPVATLVLAAARRRGVPVVIVEWPGGKPRHFSVELSTALFRSVRNGRIMIPMGRKTLRVRLLDGPRGVDSYVHMRREKVHRVLGPAMWQKGEWCRQVLRFHFDPDVAWSGIGKSPPGG